MKKEKIQNYENRTTIENNDTPEEVNKQNLLVSVRDGDEITTDFKNDEQYSD